MSSKNDYDVVIIGGGVVGTMVARELSRYRCRVLLTEAQNDLSMGASKANSGIIHGGYAEAPGSLRGRLCYPGRKAFPELEDELQFGYRRTGSLVLALSRDDLPGLEDLARQGRENGLTDLEILTREQVLSREPEVNPQVAGALYCAGAGVASPYELAIALGENARANGVEILLNSEVTALELPQDTRGLMTLTVNTPGRTRRIRSRFVVNAAGLGAQEIALMAGDGEVQLTGRKGQYILFAKDTGEAIRHVLFQMPGPRGKGVLVTSTYHGNLMIGPDAQEAAGPGDTATDTRSIRDILERARLTTRAFNTKQFIRTFSGIRAVASTGDFIIRPSRIHPGLVHAAGIQSPGLTASPAITRLILEILADQGLAVGPAARPGDMNPDFEPRRRGIIQPKNLTMKQAMDLTKLEPGNPRRIVCRCEQVTEAEIMDALSRGLPVLTTDGVKRRTRAGMGWCQGSFCRSRVAEVIERCTGIEVPPGEDVEHSGITRVGKVDLLDL